METTETATESSVESKPAPVEQPRLRGFAALTPERRRAIASKGGKAAHEIGTAYQFTSEKASEAGKKGGRAPHVRRGRSKTLNETSEKP